MNFKPFFYVIGGILLFTTGMKAGEVYTTNNFHKKMGSHKKTYDPYIESVISSWEILNNDFTNVITDDKKAKIRDGMITSMLSSVDPHAVWWTQKTIEKLNNHIDGKYIGVGIKFEKDSSGLKILSVLKGSPAENKGIVKGDHIKSVNTKDVNKQYSEVINIINDDNIKKLNLEINGKSIEIEKHPISNFNVFSSIEDLGDNGKWLRLQVNEFQLSTVNEIVSQIRDSWYPLSKNPNNGIILDLRGSPGGVVDVSSGIASLFLPENKDIVKLQLNRTKEVIPYKTVLYPREGFTKWVKEAPLIIWCDDFSASAAEILVSGLKEQGRTAWIIGENTYGKGTIQKTFPVSGAGAMTLTVGFYKTVNNEYLQWKGVTPDVIIKYPDIIKDGIAKQKEKYLTNSLTPPYQKERKDKPIYMDLPKNLKISSVELYKNITISALSLSQSYSDYLKLPHEKQ